MRTPRFFDQKNFKVWLADMCGEKFHGELSDPVKRPLTERERSPISPGGNYLKYFMLWIKNTNALFSTVLHYCIVLAHIDVTTFD